MAVIYSQLSKCINENDIDRTACINQDSSHVEIGNFSSYYHWIVVWVKDPFFFFFFIEGDGFPLNIRYLLVPVAFDAKHLGVLGYSDVLFPCVVWYACQGWTFTYEAYHIDLPIGVGAGVCCGLVMYWSNLPSLIRCSMIFLRLMHSSVLWLLCWWYQQNLPISRLSCLLGFQLDDFGII